MKKSNPHTHTVFCDGRDTVRHMADRAYSKGFVSLGFSGHGKQTCNSFGISDEHEYAREVRAAGAAYAERMRIWLGVEQDYYGVCGIDYDYRLGAVHYLTGPDGKLYGVDHSLETFTEMFEHFGGDIRALARAYYDRVYEMTLRNRPDVVVHYDLICKFNENNRFFDENDSVYRQIAMETLESIYPLCDMLEVNTGAMARLWRTRPYPTRELLCRWRELGGRVIIGSDCHDAEKLDWGFETARALIASAGYKTVWRLGTKDIVFEEDELSRRRG